MTIDGKKIAEEILEEIKNDVALRRIQGESLRLAAVLVGDNSGSRKFLELKKQAADQVGIDFRMYEFPADITTQKLRKEIVGIAKAGINHGVIIELPLPSHINVQYVLNAIPQEKDADALSERAQGKFFTNRSSILPPAVEAIKIILEKNSVNTQGKNCVVFGYGLLVGKPVSHWLASRGATVSMINEFTLDPSPFTKNADIIISGVGKPNLIKADMVKEGVTVIDFGYGNLEGKFLGDVAFDEVAKKAGLITPVPGGVGPIVVAAVLKNLITL